jgi:C1A family cysteine protease
MKEEHFMDGKTGRKNFLLVLISVMLSVALTLSIVYGETVEDVNAKIASERLLWTAGETSVSRMSPDQQRALLGGLPTPLENIDPAQIWEPPDSLSLVAYPAGYDLRDYNLVSPVEDQTTCGSCWAFSSTANLESLYIQAKGATLPLSEQAMLDCSEGTCDGWYLDTAFDYLMENGTCSGMTYPYTAVKGTCQTYAVAARINSWQWINSTGKPSSFYNDLIKSWIFTYQRPVSCRMEVYRSLFNYENGIYSHLRRERRSQGGHFVLIVGWGVSNGVEYWIVKNSWGPTWGQDGFFFIKLNDSYIGTYAIGAEIAP